MIGRAIRSPLELVGCTQWLDASQGVTYDGGTLRVSDWQDQSGAGVTVSQANGARQPLYVPAGGPNGRACISFAKARPDFLEAAWAGPTSYSSFIVSKWDDAFAAVGETIVGCNVASHLLYRNSATELAFYFGGSGGCSLPVTGALQTSWQIWDQDVSVGRQRSRHVLDRSNTTFDAAPGVLNGLRLGSRGGGGQPSNCSIAEWLCFNRVLLEGERRTVLDYLGRKYALPTGDIRERVVPSGRVGWTPLEVPNCEASFVSTWGLLSSGGLVYQWVDRARGRDLVAPDPTKRPALVAASASYNNRPTIRFNLTPGMSLDAPPWASMAQPSTFYYVGHAISHPGADQALVATPPSASWQNLTIINDSVLRMAAGVPRDAVTNMWQTPFIAKAVYDGVNSTLTIYQGGAATVLLPPGDVGAGARVSLRLGGSFLGTQPLDGELAALLIYSAVPSAPDSDRVVKYLGSLYGIATGL